MLSADGTFTNATNLADATPLPLNQWLHVVGTFQPGQSMRLYLNGSLIEQLTTGVPSQVFSSTAELQMGLQFDSSAGNHLGGIIDEAALYNRALSASEILEHYLTATVLAGDYNNDGTVDSRDYVVWRKSPPSTTLPNDTTPGSVTTADYQAWRANFGNVRIVATGAAATVPEPTALLSATFCAMVFAAASFRIARR